MDENYGVEVFDAIEGTNTPLNNIIEKAYEYGINETSSSVLAIMQEYEFSKTSVIAYLSILKDEHLKEIIEKMAKLHREKGSLVTPAELSEIIHNELMQVISSEGFREKWASMQKNGE